MEQEKLPIELMNNIGLFLDVDDLYILMVNNNMTSSFNNNFWKLKYNHDFGEDENITDWKNEYFHNIYFDKYGIPPYYVTNWYKEYVDFFMGITYEEINPHLQNNNFFWKAKYANNFNVLNLDYDPNLNWKKVYDFTKNCHCGNNKNIEIISIQARRADEVNYYIIKCDACNKKEKIRTI